MAGRVVGVAPAGEIVGAEFPGEVGTAAVDDGGEGGFALGGIDQDDLQLFQLDGGILQARCSAAISSPMP